MSILFISFLFYIVSHFILFYFIHETSCKHRCYGAEAIYVTFYLFVYFKFWDGKQNFVPNVWQFVLANISIQGRVVDSYTYMASFIALAMLCPSLPIIWKLSTVVV